MAFAGWTPAEIPGFSTAIAVQSTVDYLIGIGFNGIGFNGIGESYWKGGLTGRTRLLPSRLHPT